MRTTRRITAALAASALSIGAGLAAAAPASAGSAKDSDGTSSVTVKVKDVVSKKKTFQVKNWVTVTVKTPADYVSSTGEVVKAKWDARITDSGPANVSCNAGFRYPETIGEYHEGSGKAVYHLPKRKGLTKDPRGIYKYLYWGSGKCTITARIYVSQAGDFAQGINYYSTNYTLTTTYRNQTRPKVTFSAPKKVKKNKSFKVNGKVTAASPKDGYKTKNAKKGTKVAIQFQKNGKGKWKTVKVAKVGKGGKYSTKIKIKAKGKLRAVSQASQVLSKRASSTKKIKLG